MKIVRGLLALTALWGAACLDLQLPPSPPPPGPGTLRGTLRYVTAGRLTTSPAAGARVELLQSSNEVRSTDDGRFVLEGLVSTEGVVRITFDADGDGTIDRQKLFTLSSVSAGPGRDVSLGEVLLGRNARLVGRALRGDLPGDAFHLGTDVFVTGMEFSTFTADNGAFALDGLPEGTLQVSFFREGYRPDSREVTLPGGEEVRLADVRLEAAPSGAATVTGTVQSSLGTPVEGARLRALAFSSEGDATTGADGTLSLGPIPSGVYVMSVERAGFVSADLGRRLISPGANDLGLVTLTPGTSTPIPLDAGASSPKPDGGPDASVPDADAGLDGGGDAGAPDAGDAPDGGDAGAPDAGAPDAGDAGAPDAGDAGAPDAGVPDAGPRDSGIPCEGLCAPGFFCDVDDTCRASSCGAQSCAWCNQGQCYAKDCLGATCGAGEVCAAGTCVALACAGVSCAANSRCGNGSCLPTSCSASQPCASGKVCEFGQCVDVACVGRVCGPGALCSAGTCWPTGTPGNPCGPGAAYILGRCREVACEGVSCAAGTLCSEGQCVSGGIYVAGILTPQGNVASTNIRNAIGTTVNGHWVKLAELPDPVRQLLVSPDGAWLFARTRSLGNAPTTTLYRSQDGRTWTSLYSGTGQMNGTVEDLHLDQNTGVLTMSITGYQSNGLHRLMRSTDNGNTWSIVFAPPGPTGIRSYAPPDFFALMNPLAAGVVEGLYRFHPPLPDGGVRTLIASPAVDPFLLSDPTGVGPSFLAHPASNTYSMDGGLIGAFSVMSNGALYGPAPAQVFLLTSSNVARSYDRGLTWSFRTPPVSSPAFTGIVRGADDAIYLANEDANPPLFVSTDDGETWAEVPTEEWRRVGLHSWWNEWQPNTPVVVNNKMMPTVAKANGYVYHALTSGVTGAVEPDWADAGTIVNEGTIRWLQDIAMPFMRPTAMASRSCAPGQQRCGAGCVDVTTNLQHCGACDRPCADSCVAGQCLTTGASDGGGSVGCADGTREGFVDVGLFPDVAACAGTWTGDLDQSSAADALCASGWHVCTETDTEVRALTTAQATAFLGCFAFRASIDGFDGCERLDCSNDVNHDDVAAMGASCLALSGVSRLPSQVPDGGACFADRGGVASQCCSVSIALAGRAAGCPQRGETGVVCCR